MTRIKLLQSAFAVALMATLAAGFLHLGAEPAEAFGGINCQLYSQPGCEFVEVLQMDECTFCCYFEGPNCVGGHGYRTTPCWLDYHWE